MSDEITYEEVVKIANTICDLEGWDYSLSYSYLMDCIDGLSYQSAEYYIFDLLQDHHDYPY